MELTRKTAMSVVVAGLVALAIGLILFGETLIAGVVFLCTTVALYLRETWA